MSIDDTWFRDPAEEWTDEEIAHWLAFDQLSGGTGLGAKKVRTLYERFFTLKPLWKASRADLMETKVFTQEQVDSFISQRSTIVPSKLLDTVKKKGVSAYPFFHPNYPPLLRHIDDPPLILYLKGKLKVHELDRSVAIVGTRKSTPYGETYAQKFGGDLASLGVTVISGMAVGIDSCAHWSAIKARGRTVAVLACGVDVCYPTSNKPLYQRLIEDENCAVVSEFFPGTKPEPWRFPARNRIISGLSQGILVVEAGETSGAIITAKIGFEQNRQVFAIPGKIDCPTSMGCNRLISDSTARLVMGCQEMMSDLNWVAVAQSKEVPTIVELFGKEREVMSMVSTEPVHFDVLVEKLAMAAGELSGTLTMLELAGVVKRLPGDWFIIAAGAIVSSNPQVKSE